MVSNRAQIAALTEEMEKHPNVAKGIIGKTQAKQIWEEVAIKLNSLGPPVKSWDKWSKVWIDQKAKTKKKLTHNRLELNATGGGPNLLHNLNPVEQAIQELIILQKSVDPPGVEQGLPSAPASNEAQLSAENGAHEMPSSSVSKDLHPEHLVGETPGKKKQRSSSARMNLLEKQTNAQEVFSSEVSTRLKNIDNILQSTFKEKQKYYEAKLALKKEKLQLCKENKETTNKYRALKLQLLQQKMNRDLKKTD